MTRDQAINFLRSSGLIMTQIEEIVEALSYCKPVKITTQNKIYNGYLDKSRMLVFPDWLTYEAAVRVLKWTIEEV